MLSLSLSHQTTGFGAKSFGVSGTMFGAKSFNLLGTVLGAKSVLNLDKKIHPCHSIGEEQPYVKSGQNEGKLLKNINN